MIFNAMQLTDDHFLKPLINKGKRGSYLVREGSDRTLGWTIHGSNGFAIFREILNNGNALYILLNNQDKIIGDTVYFYTGLIGASLASELGYRYNRERHSPYLPVVEVPYTDAETFIDLLDGFKPINDHVSTEQLGIVLAKTMIG